jgi:hypothetical protein
MSIFHSEGPPNSKCDIRESYELHVVGVFNTSLMTHSRIQYTRKVHGTWQIEVVFNFLYCFGISLDKFQKIKDRDIVKIANF